MEGEAGNEELIVVIGSDHAGYLYKQELITELQKAGTKVLDAGVHDQQPADYPDVAQTLVNTLREHSVEKGILICGSGVGVSVVANKFKGIRAGVCHDAYSAHQGVEHDDMNVLCIGQRIVGIELAKEVVSIFLKARFSGEKRHNRRLEKVRSIEEHNMK